MSIKAVVFDYGKVISFPPGEEFAERLAALAGVGVEVLEPLRWKYRDDYDRGTAGGEEYYRRVLAAAGLSRDDGVVREMVQVDMESWTRINKDTVRLMGDVKKAGLQLGILSNIPREFLALARGRFPVFSLPDTAVFSCEVRAVKPEEAIYRALLDGLGCEPEEAVFFDDVERNVLGAAKLGIRAFVWQDPAAARRELRGLGVPV